MRHIQNTILSVKLCLHVTFALACACDAKIGIHDTKWMCLHLMLTFMCHTENGSDPYSVRLCHHRLDVKVDVDAEANVTCKQSLNLLHSLSHSSHLSY